MDPTATVAATLARDGVADHEITTIAAALQLPPQDAAIGNLSLGERRRVALAHALLGRADVLVLDEPTNHLDTPTVEWLEGRLAAWPGALIVVTHDRYFLDRVATRILEVDRGKVYSYEGDYAEFLMKQAERLADRDRGRVPARLVHPPRDRVDPPRRAGAHDQGEGAHRSLRCGGRLPRRPTDDQRPAQLALRLCHGPAPRQHDRRARPRLASRSAASSCSRT